MMTAGNRSKEVIASVTIPRWQMQRLKNELNQVDTTDKIPVYLIQQWGNEAIGNIEIPKVLGAPYLHEKFYRDIELEIKRVIKGDVAKTGVMLYGKPGNGKSFFIRYIALKYKLPVNIITFEPAMTNADLVRMFSHIVGPGLVLLEDFDSCFHKRDVVLPKANFTFDTLLNILDGMYSTPNKIVFFLTANNISLIDGSLKHRPSRFKFIKYIDSPDDTIRGNIFGSLNGDKEKAVSLTKGFSLDIILSLKNKIDLGNTFTQVMEEFIEDSNQVELEDKEGEKCQTRKPLNS
jgi:SpoVK/Ycf46/Vps4 family AAA+-type ATPase